MVTLETFRKRSYFFKSFAVILFFAVCLYFFSIGNYYNSDEGIILNGAWRMYQGDKLYTDFFSYIAPGSYWWAELSFHLFGPAYFSARIFSNILLAFSVISVFWLAILAGGSRFSALVASSAWFLGNILTAVVINHNNHSSYLAIITLAIIAIALIKNKPVYFFIAGLLAGVTAVFLQTKGLALTVGLAFAIFILIINRKTKAHNIFVFLGGFAAVLSIIFYLWSPFFLYETLVRWPQEHYLAVNKISKIGWLTAFAVFLAVAYAVFRIKSLLNGQIILVAGVSQFFLLLAALTRPDASHLFLTSFGLIVLGTLAADKHLLDLSEKCNFNYRVFSHLTIVALFLVVFIASASTGLEAISRERFFKNEIVLGRNFSDLYVHPFMPGLYFELGLKNPYPYDILLTGMYPESAFLDNLSKLKSEKPEFVFADYGMVRKFGYDISNALDSYISENYETASVIDTLQILKRK